MELVGLAALVAAVAWLGLAWSIRRGDRWPKVAFVLLFGVNLAGMIHDVSFVIPPSLGLAVACAVGLLVLDGLGWRITARLFDRERLIAGRK